MRRSSLVLAIACAVLLAGAVAFAAPLFTPGYENAPDFTLQAQGGERFTLSDQRGHPVVLFFGYTHCPDVCPTTLANLAHAVRARGLGDRVRVAFVTVDPRRDTPSVLRRYVALFDPHFVGLTGSRAQLDTVFDDYHVWSKEVPSGGAAGEYFMSHSTTVYFIDRDGRLRGLGDWNDSPGALQRDLRTYFS